MPLIAIQDKRTTDMVGMVGFCFAHPNAADQPDSSRRRHLGLLEPGANFQNPQLKCLRALSKAGELVRLI